VTVAHPRSNVSFPLECHVADIIDRRKDCCHRVGEGDLLRFIGIFLKVSNSLCLIYPGKGR
jgi:hypothetical protein